MPRGERALCLRVTTDLALSAAVGANIYINVRDILHSDIGDVSNRQTLNAAFIMLVHPFDVSISIGKPLNI